YSERRSAFEEAIAAGVKPALAERAFNSTLRELSREGALVHRIDDEDIKTVLIRINAGEVAKEALAPVLTALAEGKTPDEACEIAAPKVSKEELTAIIERIVTERAEFIKERGNAATGPIMGVVMKEVRGSVDGKIVNQILRETISQVLKNA
ncbi:MAG TPA: GatB/YqeY domain-containing protein, partial [Methanospirillum sp.]|nr:GatB/YqeY domain-containing protein [Methanospirillum sp.]